MKEINSFYGKRDLSDLSAEISGISMIVTGLSNQLSEKSDSLTSDSLETALFGISRYLDRITDDLDELG
ncbi:MAG: hypothetical protein H2212_15980 [Ruminococcus sp.]|nr:hypothetical protein [Ruminococcus sp.]